MDKLERLEHLNLIQVGFTIIDIKPISEIGPIHFYNYDKSYYGEYVIVYNGCIKDICNSLHFEQYKQIDPNLLGCKFIRCYDNFLRKFIRFKFIVKNNRHFWIKQFSNTWNFIEISKEYLMEPCILDKNSYLGFPIIEYNSDDDYEIDFVINSYYHGIHFSPILFYAIDLNLSPEITEKHLIYNLIK